MGSQLPTPKERKVFFINNVDQVCSPLLFPYFCIPPLYSSCCTQMLQVFQERRVMSDEVLERDIQYLIAAPLSFHSQVQKLDDMLMHQRELFAEEALKEIFPRLVSFVTQVIRPKKRNIGYLSQLPTCSSD
jgi:hypothetical protein